MSTGEYEIRDEDRLPWLETVDEDYSEGPSILRIGFLVILGLIIVAGAIFGIYWYQKHQGIEGTGALIAAQEGDYKVKPDNPGGMKVEGEGDTAFATSEGKGASNASIDLKAMPEAPMPAKTAETTKPEAKAGPAAVPTTVGQLKTPPVVIPTLPPMTQGASGGALVQLGSFPDEASANAAWAAKAKRFTYLAPLGKSVQSATVNGSTVYRLRVNTGSASQASEVCGKLKVAGEACFVAKN